MSLAELHCRPCRNSEGLLPPEEIAALLDTLPSWKRTQDGKSLVLRLTFPDFLTALAFVNRVGVLAEKEDHHPDIRFGWGYVECCLTTHSAHGLTANDFILAAKIDVLAS